VVFRHPQFVAFGFLFFSSCEAPSTAHQFWWNWGTTFGAAAATLAAVGAALYAARRKPTPPVLTLSVLREDGERTQFSTGEDVHFYHLVVGNAERSSVATRVQVFLTALDAGLPSDKLLTEVWRGNVPFRWRDQEFLPLFQKIGGARDLDLCSVGKVSGLSLLPLFVPNSLLPYVNWKLGTPCKLMLYMQARANQVDSDMVRVEIAWDGSWAADMSTHLYPKLLNS